MKKSFIVGYTVFAIAVNFLGSLIAEKIIFPLYLDSLLTISVVALCGLIPGVLCAFISNVVLSLWTNSSILFSICHICTALLAYFVFFSFGKKEKKFSLDQFLWAGLFAAISNAVLGNIIADLVFKSMPPMPQANIVVQCLYAAFGNLNFANNFAGLIENLIDKLLSSVLSFIMYFCLSKENN